MEICTPVPISEAVTKLTAALRGTGIQVKAPGYTHAVTTAWKIVPDSSISPAGWELVSPVLKGLKGLRNLRKVCKALHQSGISHSASNTSCGLHVHVGARDVEGNGRALAKLIRFHGDCESKCLKRCVPRSRRQNRYCNDMWSEVMAKARSGRITRKQAIQLSRHRGGGQRYVSLNLFGRTAKYHTIEFRRGAASVEFPKIAAWVITHICMVDAASSLKSKRTLPGFLKAMKMGRGHRLKTWAGKYMMARLRHFQNPSGRFQGPRVPAF